MYLHPYPAIGRKAIPVRNGTETFVRDMPRIFNQGPEQKMARRKGGSLPIRFPLWFGRYITFFSSKITICLILIVFSLLKYAYETSTFIVFTCIH